MPTLYSDVVPRQLLDSMAVRSASLGTIGANYPKHKKTKYMYKWMAVVHASQWLADWADLIPAVGAVQVPYHLTPLLQRC